MNRLNMFCEDNGELGQGQELYLTRRAWLDHFQRVMEMAASSPLAACLWYDECIRTKCKTFNDQRACGFDSEFMLNARMLFTSGAPTLGVARRCDKCGDAHHAGSPLCSKGGAKNDTPPTKQQHPTPNAPAKPANPNPPAKSKQVENGRGTVLKGCLVVWDSKAVCQKFNKGSCTGCNYQHLCNKCGLVGHAGSACPAPKRW